MGYTPFSPEKCLNYKKCEMTRSWFRRFIYVCDSTCKNYKTKKPKYSPPAPNGNEYKECKYCGKYDCACGCQDKVRVK